jgi:hypothetical protein
VPLHENLRAIAYVAKQDPLLIVGLCLLGFGVFLYSHMQLKLSDAGIKAPSWPTPTNVYLLHSKYLESGRQRGWPGWPGYVSLVVFALGIFATVGGMFLWQD